MTPVLTSERLDGIGHVRHGFFTRQGGVSGGRYTSLNCGLGSGDEPERVVENRRRAMHRLGLGNDALTTVYQVHSATVVAVDSPWPAAERPRADGLVARKEGIALGIVTADCAPVLLADAGTGVVGAAHAGWRGARAGVVEATVRAMVEAGADITRIVAAVGPCIQRASYEVGPAFRAAFLAGEPTTEDLFDRAARAGHFRFDLSSYVARRLMHAGVGAADVLRLDTCADAERFFSYRRTTLDGGGDYGRLLSAIAVAADDDRR